MFCFTFFASRNRYDWSVKRKTFLLSYLVHFPFTSHPSRFLIMINTFIRVSAILVLVVEAAAMSGPWQQTITYSDSSCTNISSASYIQPENG